MIAKMFEQLLSCCCALSRVLWVVATLPVTLYEIETKFQRRTKLLNADKEKWLYIAMGRI